MWKKIVVVTLALTIVGATAVALWDNHSAFDPATAYAEDDGVSAEVPAAVPVHTQQGSGLGNETISRTPDAVGSPWSAEAEIVTVDDAGMTVKLVDGAEVFVELGQPAYWQSQGVPLSAGDRVSITGFENDGQIHAATVAKADGAVLQLRSTTGQPLWAGGQGQTAQGDNAPGTTEQISLENWQTITGTISAVTGSGLTMQRSDGSSIVLQLGRKDFWQSQDVEFASGDAVTVQGIAQGEQFQVAQVTKVSTGERILLRDPNGRPLWGGPGRNGRGGQAGAQVTSAATQPTTQDQ